MTIPGNATFTLGFIGGHQLLSKMLLADSALASTIDNMRGSTIFAPTTRALRAYLATSPSNVSLSTVIKNHLVLNRAVYSPLLDGQGSLISASGQDISFDAGSNTIRLGQDSAKVTQYDIMHRGGVIHLIDAVFSSTTLDQARADQAAQSAQASADPYIAGPVSVENAASSQGSDVPAGGAARNSTIQAINAGNSSTSDSGSSSGASKGGGTGSSSSSGKSSSAGMLGLPAFTLFSAILLLSTLLSL